jgi:hypothetical protein
MTIFFIFYLFMRDFFCFGDCGVCHSPLSLLVSGSCSKNQLSSPVTARIRKSGSVLSRWSISADTSFWHALWWSFECFWNDLSTYCTHVEILSNNLVDRTFIKFIGDHSNCQTSILTTESPHMVDVCACSHNSSSTVSLPFTKSLCHEILEHVRENHYQTLSESFRSGSCLGNRD